MFDFGGATLNNFDIGDFSFGTLLAGTELSDYSFKITNHTLDLSISAVPEPGNWGTGVLLLGVFATRRLGRTLKVQGRRTQS
ncbi:MAG: hypothetical protein JWL59_4958 [Chthoniobacteraceae bacterium]|nr:hypothetical protein [Chthoniobacteraceae bacterium]